VERHAGLATKGLRTFRPLGLGGPHITEVIKGLCPVLVLHPYILPPFQTMLRKFFLYLTEGA
jgi:hypothetical protein